MLRNVSQEKTFATKKHPELLTIKARYGYGWLSPSMELPSAPPNLGETFWVKSMIATLPPPHYVRPIFAKFLQPSRASSPPLSPRGRRRGWHFAGRVT